jgi:hypothetical protein
MDEICVAWDAHKLKTDLLPHKRLTLLMAPVGWILAAVGPRQVGRM